MPVVSTKLVDRRNGCDIELITEEVMSIQRPGCMRKVGSFRILTSKPPRKLIWKRVRSLTEAVRLVDERPSPNALRHHRTIQEIKCRDSER
jgi:hypothetical protein